MLSGYSAAELLRASCGREDAAAEVTVPGTRRRAGPHLVVHRDLLSLDERLIVMGVAMTTDCRTAFDIVRWNSVTDGVVAVDALARLGRFTPDDLRALRSRHLGVRGVRKLEPVLLRADPSAESPMESRIRWPCTMRACPRRPSSILSW